MPYYRRDRRDSEKCLRFITCRVIQGLPFLAREAFKFVILGILGRAQSKYSIRIHAFVFMGNHYHFLISGKAKNISPFMNYVNGELAKVFRRLTGGYRGKFWETRFKEQKMGTVYDVIRMIVYIFLNPVKAGLVRNPSEYPGLLSCNLPQRLNVKWVRPSKVRFMNLEYDRVQDIEEVKRLEECAEESYDLVIDLFGWRDCFEEEVREEMLYELLAEELKKQVEGEKHFKGRDWLVKQKLDLEWVTKKRSPTPFVICHDQELRKQLIEDYNTFVSECRAGWHKLKSGEGKAMFPSGCYLPSMIKDFAKLDVGGDSIVYVEFKSIDPPSFVAEV